MDKIKVVISDYIEPDLNWEEEQFRELGIDFSIFQLKFALPEEILRYTSDANILIVNMAKITGEVIAGLHKCKLIIRHGAGYDNVDVVAANERGIQVAYVPDYCVNEVAEQAVMLIFACQRKLLTQSRILETSSRQGEWQFDPVYPVFTIKGKTLGLVGCGRIGSTVYRMLQGFGLHFLICDPYLSEKSKDAMGIETVPLEYLLRKSDIITIHAPLNEETYHLIDEAELKLMKPSGTLINTARGGIVNLRALDKALRIGEIAHAGVDVYEEKEPPDPNHPLLSNDNAICTPHLAWLSKESGWSIREKIVEDVRRFLRGEPPRFPIDFNALTEPKVYR